MFEETFHRRIRLRFILPGFNGDSQVAINTKIPAENGVGDIVRSPIGEKKIKSLQIVEVECPGFPSLIKISHASVVKIPDVIHDKLVALNLPVRNLCDIGSPVFIIGRGQGLPPDQQDCKNCQTGQTAFNKRPGIDEGCRQTHTENTGQKNFKPVRLRTRQVQRSYPPHPGKSQAQEKNNFKE